MKMFKFQDQMRQPSMVDAEKVISISSFPIGAAVFAVITYEVGGAQYLTVQSSESNAELISRLEQVLNS